MAYESLADVYDAFNEDANYEALYEKIQSVLHRAGISKGIIADLGCGTGDMTLMLAQSGYDMIGIDASEEMLCILREKAAELEVEGLLLLQQDLRQLDLYGTIHAAISTFDTFNHIGPYEEFEKALVRSALFIEPGGIFLFDLNTPYKHEHILANHTYEMEAQDVLCLWKNRYDEKARATHISVEIQDKETGERETDAFVEYAYDLPQVRRACEEAGLDILEICDGETFGELTPTAQRYCITAVKRSDKNCNAIYQSKENEAWED